MHARLNRLGGLLAATTLTIVSATVATTTQTAVAADPIPGLKVSSPQKVTTESYGGWVYTDLGLHLVAVDAAVQIEAHRPSYDSEIVAEWVNAPGGPQALPEGAMSTFAGLDGFADISVTRVSDGEVVTGWTHTTCLNGYAQRVDPSAPASSPYPDRCPWNPYTLGSVMGIERGYSTTLLDPWGTELRVKPGKYDVTATISPTWTDFFDITEADATTTTRLVVLDGGSFRKAPERETTSDLAQPHAKAPVSVDPCTPDEPKPDLRSLPAFGIVLNRKGTTLRFAANVWNGGNTPLVVDGFRNEDDEDMTAYQYFFDADGEQACYEQVGEMHWHAENHQHWHFEDFAQYTLLDENLENPILSEKQSFCLAATDAVDYTVEGADWHPQNTDLSTACGGPGALSIREVLSSGSGDTYFQYRAGQAFRIKDLPDGVYWIAVTANPLGNLVESDETNNESFRRIRLGTNKSGGRFVRVPQLGIIDETDLFGGR